MKSFALLSAILLLWTPMLLAQGSAEDFVGTWELLAIEIQNESGEWVPGGSPMGERPVGILMYDGAGNMSVQITGSPRTAETPPDLPEIVNGYIAYYGRYEVNSAEGTVTHHRRNHINPGLGSLSVVRHFKFDGDHLTLTVAPERQLRLTWVCAH